MRMFALGSPGHARWLAAEGDRLLEFGRASRHPAGGFAWLDDDGAPRLDGPVELWITCRMTHVYALGHMVGRSDCSALADHGVAALRGRFRDATHGGWYAKVWADALWGYAHCDTDNATPPTVAAALWWGIASRYPDEVEEWLQACGRI